MKYNLVIKPIHHDDKLMNKYHLIPWFCTLYRSTKMSYLKKRFIVSNKQKPKKPTEDAHTCMYLLKIILFYFKILQTWIFTKLETMFRFVSFA